MSAVYQQRDAAVAAWQLEREKVAALTAHLQAAQATIADAKHYLETERWDDPTFDPVAILSRADTSAYDTAIRAAKNEGWREACQALAWCFDNGPERDALPYLVEHNPFHTASIEQTEAE